MDKVTKLFLCSLIVFLQSQVLWAAEIYKWTDEQGKVHFGDQKAKPSNIKAESLSLEEDKAVRVGRVSEDTKANLIEALKKQGLTLSESPSTSKKESLPTFDEGSSFIGTKRVSVECREIAERIAQTPAGVPFVGLASQFSSKCPNLTYECLTYKRQPEKSKCQWIRKQNQHIVSHKVYE